MTAVNDLCRDCLNGDHNPDSWCLDCDCTMCGKPETGWTITPAGYLVPDDLDDDPRLWTGEVAR